MKQFEVHSEHDPETWLKLWNRRVVAFNSANRAAYSGEMCFFGIQDKNKLDVFFHKDYSTVYMATRFMGRIEAEGTGSKITGVIGKMRSAVIFLWFMFVAMGIGSVVMMTQHQLQAAAALLILSLVGLGGALITPKESAARLENLLKFISTEEYDEDEEIEPEAAAEE